MSVLSHSLLQASLAITLAALAPGAAGAAAGPGPTRVGAPTTNVRRGLLVVPYRGAAPRWTLQAVRGHPRTFSLDFGAGTAILPGPLAGRLDGTAFQAWALHSRTPSLRLEAVANRPTAAILFAPRAPHPAMSAPYFDAAHRRVVVPLDGAPPACQMRWHVTDESLVTLDLGPTDPPFGISYGEFRGPGRTFKRWSVEHHGDTTSLSLRLARRGVINVVRDPAGRRLLVTQEPLVAPSRAWISPVLPQELSPLPAAVSSPAVAAPSDGASASPPGEASPVVASPILGDMPRSLVAIGQARYEPGVQVLWLPCAEALRNVEAIADPRTPLRLRLDFHQAMTPSGPLAGTVATGWLTGWSWQLTEPDHAVLELHLRRPGPVTLLDDRARRALALGGLTLPRAQAAAVPCHPHPHSRPTPKPTPRPTPKPTLRPAPMPTLRPTPIPTARPTPSPTACPTPIPALPTTPVLPAVATPTPPSPAYATAAPLVRPAPTPTPAPLRRSRVAPRTVFGAAAFDPARQLIALPYRGAAPSYAIRRDAVTGLHVEFPASVLETTVTQALPGNPLLLRWSGANELATTTASLDLELAREGDVLVARDDVRHELLIIPQLAGALPAAFGAPPPITTVFGRASFGAQAGGLVVPYFGESPTYTIERVSPTYAYLDFQQAALNPLGVQCDAVTDYPLVSFWLLAARPVGNVVRVAVNLPYGGTLHVLDDRVNRRVLVVPRLGSGDARPSAD